MASKPSRFGGGTPTRTLKSRDYSSFAFAHTSQPPMLPAYSTPTKLASTLNHQAYAALSSGFLEPISQQSPPGIYSSGPANTSSSFEDDSDDCVLVPRRPIPSARTANTNPSRSEGSSIRVIDSSYTTWLSHEKSASCAKRPSPHPTTCLEDEDDIVLNFLSDTDDLVSEKHAVTSLIIPTGEAILPTEDSRPTLALSVIHGPLVKSIVPASSEPISATGSSSICSSATLVGTLKMKETKLVAQPTEVGSVQPTSNRAAENSRRPANTLQLPLPAVSDTVESSELNQQLPEEGYSEPQTAGDRSFIARVGNLSDEDTSPQPPSATHELVPTSNGPLQEMLLTRKATDLGCVPETSSSGAVLEDPSSIKSAQDSEKISLPQDLESLENDIPVEIPSARSFLGSVPSPSSDRDPPKRLVSSETNIAEPNVISNAEPPAGRSVLTALEPQSDAVQHQGTHTITSKTTAPPSFRESVLSVSPRIPRPPHTHSLPPLDTWEELCAELKFLYAELGMAPQLMKETSYNL